ncbi:inosine-5'-monophosphate dehydrogenase [Streptomyces globisporus C-1027]|uniref:Inosine-5'-monophosphate dehydrogenase n=1 Tax=Streptomyces globisporus C-1027 TaxID=1172567 RepID=A0A0U3JYI2_STRGL|nr:MULTISPECIES: CBS domain-containing protein [Streptomyces]ALU91917.1 inosine-5'-monophosphate dehydrogenase [Streptomyces globisporus C-1027]OKJ18081.1 inosine-5'-monophosphate dehydrogenase [Streptomyces sp. CB02130]
MQHRTVFEVMTHDVVTATSQTSFKQIARLFAEHDVSAVPVVDPERRLLGLVSEADLLRATAELPDLEGRPAGVRLLSQERGLPAAETAAQLMTSPAVTAQPNWNLVETARTMHRKGVKRLPVTDETGRLVGIISRSDLLRPFLRSDTAIRDEIVHDVLAHTLRLAPDTIRVTVDDGVVRLTGRVDERADIPVIVRLCRSVDGVVALHESIEYAYDNLALDVEPPR